ncbi:hypothetical protein IMSAG249_01542 [Lachnospiraceae bacterium]|nr:hypothetical protein IMSAG249_01542 [Lachnospiraceae bacterium]
MVRIMTLIGLARNTGNNGIGRILFIGPPHLLGTPHGDTVVVARSTFCTHNIIKLSSFGQMGGLNAPPVRTALPHPFRITYDLLFLCGILHHTDCPRLFIPFPGLPFQRDHVLFPVIIMKNGCIKPGRMKIHGTAPGAFDVLCRNQVIIHIKIPCVHGIHDPVYHIKQIFLPAVCQTRRPDSLCTWKLFQIHFLIVGQHMGIQFPVFQIL